MTEPTPAGCLLCHRPADGGSLCVGCTKDTLVRLESLPTLYRALAAFLVPSPSASTGGRTASLAHSPMPVAELPLTMRGPGGMVGVAEDWYTLVREERGMSPLAPPVGSVEGRLRGAVTGLCANLPWIAVSWPLAGSFAEEIRGVVRSAVAVISPPVPVDRGTVLGPCPAQLPDGTLCGTDLRLFTGAQLVTCPGCTSTFPPATWTGLKVWMDSDAKTPSDAT
ncbi:hypothetical protein [Streptomyces niveus]|uniref:hypothetical protein n=1 Tax=Streptomyces niveus TaxID=193462 RepID=UPI0033B096F7